MSIFIINILMHIKRKISNLLTSSYSKYDMLCLDAGI